MDRRALASLRASRGYPQFLVAATVARLADEMFAVGVVLLVLERTGSPALAGLTIAAATLPAIASGPVIGAWLDRTGKRSLLYKVDRLLLVACLLGILAAAGHSPDFVVPLLGFITGTTLPATFGGLTSFIPLLVEPDLLGPANALEASSFNAALILGPAIAGTAVALGGPPAASLPVALVLVSVAAVPEGPAFAATFSVRQQRTPTALLAHVMSTLSSLKVAFFSLGAALGGPLAESVGPRALLLIVAGVQLTGVVIGLAMRAAVVSPAGARRSAG